jgi:hypothetical protein
METSLSPRRPRNLHGTRFVAMALVLLAIAALVVPPATALSIIGVSQPGTGLSVVPIDPCVPTPQIVSFTVTPTTSPFGQNVTLSWNVQVPSGCNYLVALLGQSVGLKGSLQVQPVFDTSYTLTLSWGPTRSLYTIKTTPVVSVTVPKDPSDPTGTRNLITISSQQMVPMFVRALSTANTTVVVNADLDLSGLPNSFFQSRILIGDGVQLIGGRAALPGQPFQPGPLLFTTDNPQNLFEIVGDNVRVTGVRVQGPDMGVADNTMSTGLLISDVGGTIPNHINVKVDHNEFSGWSHAAVEVTDYPGHIVVLSRIDPASTPIEVVYSLPTEPVWIHDNFFHHNQHSNGNGYGVAVAHGAHALIEQNVFDWNRHAITQEDGTSRTGYRAYRNLVLENGGLNQWLYGFGWQHTQQFDMHGSQSQCVVSLNTGISSTCLASVDHMLGQAGHEYDIRYNSFLYKDGPAIKLRGTPELGLPSSTVVRFNVFAHDHDWDDAVKWTEGAPVVQDNLTGRTTYYGLQTCDFDGDGIKDVFIATEQTLWYCPAPSDCVTATGSGKASWVYLNSSTKRTDQLSLGYFSGGRVCDVVDGGLISVGGSGPWRQMLLNLRAQ